jgi:hypothetical protein
MRKNNYTTLRDKIYQSACNLKQIKVWRIVDIIECENIKNWKTKLSLLEDVSNTLGFSLSQKASSKDVYNLYF